MAEITVQSVKVNALANFVAADAGGDTFENDGNVHFVVSNRRQTDVTITIQGQRAPDHPDDPIIDREHTIPGLETRVIPHVSPRFFNDSTGKVVVDYDDAANIFVGAFHAPREL